MGRMAMREAYGLALAELGAEMAEVVALDADVSSSSKSSIFGAKFPDRFFNVGVSEANMCGMAAGMAMRGKIPFVHCFASFMMLRAADPIRSLACYQRLPVKFCGAYAGLSDSYDGASHHSITDIAFFRALPSLTVLSPCDAAETRLAVREAVRVDGPVYLRILRSEVDDVFGPGHRIAIGGSSMIRDGSDLSILATGYMTSKALRAAEILARDGIRARVVNVHSIKPIDTAMIVRCAEETGALMTVEEHSVIGGLGGAVAEVASRHSPVVLERVGIEDTFAESGDYEKLLIKYGLGETSIAERAKAMLRGRTRKAGSN